MLMMIMLMIIMAMTMMKTGSLQASTCTDHQLHKFQVELTFLHNSCPHLMWAACVRAARCYGA